MDFKRYPKSYEINARERYRYLMRRKDIFTHYSTVKGKRNHIESISKKGIEFRTEKSTSNKFIPAPNIKKAIRYVFYRKTATRKELEQFSRFSSALLGLLRILLEDISRFLQTPSGLFRLTILGCRYFFSGLDRGSSKDWEAIVKNKAEFVLMSYFYLREKSEKSWLIMKRILKYFGIKLLLDCGEFSVYERLQKGKPAEPIDIYQLAKCIKENEDVLFGYFTLDKIGDPETTKKNTALLYELTGIKPIPIWHCNPENWEQSDWDGLVNLVNEDHELIGIGATVPLGKKAGPNRQNEVKRNLFKKVFELCPNQCFHWLGGSSNLMLEFPFFSADSQGWRQGRMDSKQIYVFNEEKATQEGPDCWSKEQCLDFNVHSLTKVEILPKGMQLSLFEDVVPDSVII